MNIETRVNEGSAALHCYLAMDQQTKAAIIFGMVRGFEAGGYPEHFNEDDITAWRMKGNFAHQMLNGGVFNPLDAFAVIALFDDEFSEL